jgi:hypothetical protein
LKKYFELYYYHYDSPIYQRVIFMFTCLPGKMDYPWHRSGKLPDG